MLSGLTAELCFDATDFRVYVMGHSHVALSFHRPEGFPAAGSTQREGVELDLTQGDWLINPGSAGQPRDGDPRAAWLLLEGANVGWLPGADTDRGCAGSDPAARLPRLAGRATPVRAVTWTF